MNLTEKKLRKIIRKLIREGGGEAAGTMELLDITLEEARKFASSGGFNLDKKIPEFDKHFKAAQKKARLGRTQRKNMPVINDDDVKKFQKRLKQGKIDINEPFAKDSNPSNPFPTGLSGFEADEFLKRGVKDGSKKDDKIDITIKKKSVKDLKPIQRQIYFDKSMGAIKKFGIKGTVDFLSNKSFFITSEDDYIIDGHHRMLSGMLINPDMKVNTLSIDLPIRKLLPLSLAYGDAIGNKRNA